MIGKSLGHYEIVAPLGAGGMGEVYRARDTSLQRDVAIKLVPGELAADAERFARLQREAFALAALNHPNIATIHGLDREGTLRYIVLELVEGETLDQRLRRGRMPLAEALEAARQIAEALEVAHGRGIVHRDLKPANVMINERGHVKVLDFGLAKNLQPAAPGGAAAARRDAIDPSVATAMQVSDSDVTNLTKAGSVLGTAPYMSPEQIRSDELDERSDNWAFGCVLFEMLAGKRAFDRDTIADTLAAVLEHEPDWDALPADTPRGIRSLLVRCLEKDRRRRVHHIADARIEIDTVLRSQSGATSPGLTVPRRRPRWLAPVAGVAAVLSVATLFAFNVGGLRELTLRAIGAPAISAPGANDLAGLVVLPLRNASGDAGREFFVDGMTDGLISRLQSIGNLRVISRTSSMAYKTDAPPLPQIGRALGVDRAIEGSVTEAGGDVTIDVHLLDPATETALWSGDFTRPASEVMALHNEVARAVAVQLGVMLTEQAQAGLASARPFNPQAIDLYIKAENIYALRNPATFFEAADLYRQALDLEPRFAQAWASLGGIYANMAYYFTMPPAQARELGLQYTEKAIELNPGLAEAYMQRSWARLLVEWDWQGALADLQHAITLEPGYADAHRSYGDLLVHYGRYEEGLEELQLAIDLDPLDLQALRQLGEGLEVVGRFEEAVGVYNLIFERDPDWLMGHLFAAGAYIGLGRGQEAVREAERAVELGGRRVTFALVRLAGAYVAAGRDADATAVFEELESMKETTFIDPTFVAFYQFYRGDTDAAWATLQEAVDTGSTMLKHLNEIFYANPEVRSDPRYREIMEQVGLGHTVAAGGQ